MHHGTTLLVFTALLSLSCAYSIWPQPQVFTRGTTPLTLAPGKFQFTTTSKSQILAAAIDRYKFLSFPFLQVSLAPDVAVLESINIIVDTTNEELQFGTNENYTLTVSTSGATIQAPTVFGAMHGLESFAQLIDFNYTASYYTIEETPISITDYPRFPWRGIMIDTGRHYLQVDTITTMIEVLSYHKMNTLHWHVTDSQSFPMQSVAYPKLAEEGSYFYPAATYSAQDVKDIVTYGYFLGVRVVPEFDIPGHSYSWGLGYPNLTINCSEVPLWGVNAATLDITKDETYTVLDGFLGEMKGLFMDDFMHLGSDEVVYECWNMTPAVLDFMKQNGMSTFNQVEQYFEDNLFKITQQNKINNRVFWEDAYINNGIKFDLNTSTFQVWLGRDGLVTFAQAGYKVILSSGFYLDVQEPGTQVHYEWVDTWQDFYTNEPFSGSAANLTAAEREFVIGGEACMWGEAVEDENIFSRVWVRASGAAEKLWSDMDFTVNADLPAAQIRLIEMRCRLKRRDIHATPIRPDYCPTPEDLARKH